VCGFVGLASREPLQDRDRGAVEGAASSIQHRGPDSSGVVRAANLHVAFRRLSIVDLEGGHQPLTNEDGSVEVFLNGEIFNHDSLRRELRHRGHVFRTRSDTEVLPHLWEEHGHAMLPLLNGMFAICVIDHRTGTVFLARDRLGIKPLYVAAFRRGVVFASELKAVLASGLIERSIDRDAAVRLIDTLSTGGRTTLVSGVERLLPGEMLWFDVGGETHRQRWYDLASNLEADVAPTGPAEVMEALRDSVSLRLEADVPVGISLSGGIDSTLLAVLAREGGHRDVAAFTVDFAGAPPEEVSSARAVAAHLGLRHEVLRTSTSEYEREAPFSVWASDEPIADPAFYPALKVAEAAASSVTVLLAGSGADEIFAGYAHHRLSPKRRVVAATPRVASRLAAPVLERLGLSADEAHALLEYRSTRYHWHSLAMSHLTAGDRAAIRGGRRVGTEDPLAEAFSRLPRGSQLRQQLFADTVTYLPDQLLPLLDRTTMAFSIEGRVPYLDHRVVEAALRLPDAQKLDALRGRTKLNLRRELEGKVPQAVLTRPKAGFPSAVQMWLHGELGAMVPAILSDRAGIVRELFSDRWVQELVASRGTMLSRWPLVNALLTLEIWHRIFIVEGLNERPDMSLSELFKLKSVGV
jgi:asparagine synthase (glutamine-hydrolysing)